MIKNKLIVFFKDGFVSKSLKVLLLRVGGVILFFSLTLFLTNIFPTEEVGKYDFTRSLLLILGGICLLGTDQAIIFYSGVLKAKNKLGELKRIYKKMMLMIFASSIIIVVLFLIIPNSLINLFFNKAGTSQLLLKVTLSIAAFTITLLNIDTLRALQKPLFSELYRNIYRHVSFLVIAIILFLTHHTFWLTEAFLFSFFILAISSSYRVHKAFKSFNNDYIKKPYSYKDILKRSFPMALSSISYFLMQSVDIILLGKFSDFETVAYYASAVKIATITSLVLLSVNIIAGPKIAEFYSNNDFASLKTIVKKSSRLIILFSVPAILFLFIFSEFILSLFGEHFIVAKEALWILLLGQFFRSLSGPIAIYMNMTGKQNKLNQFLFIGLIINIILNWFCIPVFGMIGAAFATAFSILLWNALAILYSYKKDKIKTFIS